RRYASTNTHGTGTRSRKRVGFLICHSGWRSRTRLRILLNEPRAQVHVELHERRVADAAKAVDFTRLDDQDVAGSGLELLAVDRPQSSAFSDELDFVVRVTMRARAVAGKGSEQEHGYLDVAVVGADEVMRAAVEWQVLLANA